MKHSKKKKKKLKQKEKATVPLSLVIPRLQLQDQRLPEYGVSQHRAARKRPCGSIHLWGHWRRGEGGMSDSQPARRRMQGAPGRGCRWGFLWVRPWVTARLVLHFGDVATLAQPPMPQQPVCPWEVLQNTKCEVLIISKLFVRGAGVKNSRMGVKKDQIQSYLLAPLTLVRLLPTVDTLVSLQVVALNKPHITHVASKWLLSWKSTQIKSMHQFWCLIPDVYQQSYSPNTYKIIP